MVFSKVRELYINWLVRQRRLVISLVVASCMVAASGLAGLKFTSEYRVFFKPDNPHLLAYDDLQDRYAKSNNIFIAVAIDEGSVFVPEVLRTLSELTDAAWRLPYVERVDSLVNFQVIAGDGNELEVRDLVSDLDELDNTDLEQLARVARAEPDLMGVLVNDDLTVAGINLSIADEGASELGLPILMQSLRGVLKEFAVENSNLGVHLTGSVMVTDAMNSQAEKDMMTLYPLMYVLVIALTYAMMRSSTAVIGTVIVATLAVLSTLGLVGWIGIKITPVSIATPTIIMTLAVAHCMHIVITMQDEMFAGKAPQEAVGQSLMKNFSPIFLVTFTTIVGFVAMTASEVPPLVDLGIMLAIGVTIVYILSIAFLPAFLATFPVSSRSRRHESAALLGLTSFVMKRYRAVVVVFTVAIGVSVIPVGRNEINDNFIGYFSEDVSLYRDSHFISDRLTGIHNIHFSLDAGGDNEVFEPEYLSIVDEFSHWLRQQNGVRNVSSVADLMKRINREMNGSEAFYMLPDTREMAAQYFFLYELSLPLGLPATERVDLVKSATRVTATIDNLSSAEILSLNEKARQWFEKNSEHVTAPQGSAPVVMFADIGQRNARSLVQGTVVAMVFISLILAYALRSFCVGIICLIPNLVPILIAFAVWGLVDGEVGMALSVVAVMAFGIIVDDTVHWISRYVARRRRGCTVEQAAAEASDKAGKAMVGTTVVLVAGFLVLTLSGFRLNAGLGFMTAVIIGVALVTDLVFLPALLKMLDRKVEWVANTVAASE